MPTQKEGQHGSGTRKFVTTTFIGGLAVLLPIYLTVLFVTSLMQGLSKLFAPLINGLLSILSLQHPVAERILGIGILIALCFLCGLALRTSVGALMRTRIQPKLQKLPGYSLLATLTQQLTGLAEKDELRAVAVALGGLDESLSIGFLIDHQPGLGYVVFVPSVPTPASGDLFIVSEDKVFPLDLPFAKAVKFYSQWGLGSAEVMQAVAARAAAARPTNPV